MLTKRLLLILLTALCLCMLPVDMFAQSASVVGTVKDQSGAVLPGVSISIKNTGTGLTRDVLTNETGDYTVPLLPIGSYQVTAEFPGFKTQIKSGITLKVDDRSRIDFGLQLGDVSERIVVTESAPLVQSENASIGNVIDHAKIVDLPLDGREFYSLARLNPAVYEPAQNSTLGFRGGFNVAGASEASNNYSLDGIENMDPTSNQPAHRPSVDTIQEFKVLTGTYSAEYGRHSGGQILVTTKSGTNELHGSAYEFYRNSLMDARNFFSPTINPFKRNNFGVTIGGPIVKNRTFIFGGYEGVRANEQQTILSTVPSNAMRNGDLSELLNPSNPFTGRSTTVRDPVTNQNFPGNVIPANRIDRVAKALIGLWYPAPNRAGANNYVASGNKTVTNDQFNIKLDHKLTDKNNISGGYQFMNLRPYEPLGAISLCGSRTLPGLGCTDKTATMATFISDVHVFSPNVINEFKIGYTRLFAWRMPEAGDKGYSKILNIPGLPGAEFPGNQGGPQVSISGFATIGPSSGNPQGRWDNDYNLIDSIAINHRNHAMKVGGDLRFFQFNSFHAANRPGAFSFNGFMTGYAFGDFMLGFPRSAMRNTGVPFTVSTDTSYNFYAQDDWKVSNKLTLNLGLRYEYNRPIRERADQLATFDASNGHLRVARCGDAFIDASGNLVFNKGTCSNRQIYSLDKNNFAPRIGIAYRPMANSAFVVRAGYGIYYDVIVSGNGLSGLFRGLPYRIQSSLTAATSAPIPLSDPFTPAPGRAVARFTQPAIQKNLVTPYVQQYSLGLQRELGTSAVAEVTYMGSIGQKLWDSIAINNPAPGAGSVDSRRPYQPWGAINYNGSIGRSSYNSMQLRLEKRMASGVSGLMSYTFGKSIDTGTGAATSSDGDSGTQNPLNYRAEKGLSGFDVRHRLVTSYQIEMPFGKGRHFLANAPALVDALLGGWDMSGIVTVQSGTPFTPTISTDNANVGTSNQRPNLTGNPKVSNPTPDRWYDKSAFCFSAACGLAPFTYGNAGRDILTGPGIKRWDFSLLKNFQIREKQRMQFRAEFFNFTNHPNFYLPGSVVDTGRAGTISQAGPARDIQLALKYIF